MFRQQLPVYSPLDFPAVRAGGAALLLRGRARALEVEVGNAVCAHHACRAILFTDSGTSALTLAIRAAMQDRNAVVALPAFSCYDVATAAEGVGPDLRVALYDVEPETLSPHLPSLERALEQGVGVVVVAHLYGYPVDVAAVAGIAARHGAVVVEDAAQGSSARVGGRPVGTTGSIAVLSFGRGKGVTGGGGGAMLANDELGVRLVERARGWTGPARPGWSQWVKLVGQWMVGRPSVYALPAALPFLHLGETTYRRPEAPRGMPLSSIATLARTWGLAAAEADRRRRNAERLIGRLAGRRTFTTIRAPGLAQPGYLRLPALCTAGSGAGQRARRLGVMPGYPRPLGELSGIAPRLIDREPLPGAARLVKELLTLPTHGLLRERDLRALESWIDVVG